MTFFILIPLGLIFAAIGAVTGPLLVGLAVALVIWAVAYFANQTGHPGLVWAALIGGAIVLAWSVERYKLNQARREVFGWPDHQLQGWVKAAYGIDERRRRAIIEELRRRGLPTPAEEALAAKKAADAKRAAEAARKAALAVGYKEYRRVLRATGDEKTARAASWAACEKAGGPKGPGL